MLDRVVLPYDFSFDPTSVIVLIHGLITLIDLGKYIILLYELFLVLFRVCWLVCGSHV